MATRLPAVDGSDFPRLAELGELAAAERDGGGGGAEEERAGEEEEYDDDDDDDDDELSAEDEDQVDAALGALGPDAFAARGGGGGGGARGGRAQARVGDAHTGSAHVGSAAANSIRASEKKAEAHRPVGLSREGRATTEGVLDPRTRMILFKLLSAGHIASIHGCVSTGKEANVYYAIERSRRDGAGDAELPGREVAVKVFKTSILVFRDRDKYVAGEFRFRHGYCRSNPRKMVRTWAEKEMRNYLRIHAAGLRCPEPLLLRGHVLLMRFVGVEGRAAPLLKDAGLSPERSASAYAQCVLLMRRLYHDCKLVHADLSEYNLLWLKGQLWVIDVSQSVEHDHPNALAFLRKDCANVVGWARRQGVAPVLSARQLFEFVTDEALPTHGATPQAGAPVEPARAAEIAAVSARLEAALDALHAAGEAEAEALGGSGDDEEDGEEGEEEGEAEGEAEGGAGAGEGGSRAGGEPSASARAALRAEASVSAAVFQEVHIPQNLNSISRKQFERDAALAAQGRTAELLFGGGVVGAGPLAAAVAGLAGAHGAAGAAEGAEPAGAGASSGESGGEEEGGEEGGEEGEEGEGRASRVRRALHRNEDPEARRERKRAVREAQRLSRETKLPKHVKRNPAAKAKSKVKAAGAGGGKGGGKARGGVLAAALAVD